MKLSKSLLKKLILAGCRVINLGLEKGSDIALSRMDKKMRVAEHAKAIKKARRAANDAGLDILINGTFIMGGPVETPQDIKDTIIHAFKLDLDGLAIFPLEIHPATKDYEKAVEMGVIEPSLNPYLKLKRYPLFFSETVSKELLIELNDGFSGVFERLRSCREQVNILGNEQGIILPRIADIACLSDDGPASDLIISDKYARWFQKLLKKQVAMKWSEGRASSSLSDIREITEEIQLIESQLNEHRQQNHEYCTGDYLDGSLEYACKEFLTAFNDIVKKIDYGLRNC